MKIEQKKENTFAPVAITLETKDEFMALYGISNLSSEDIEDLSDTMNSEHIDKVKLTYFFSNLFELLHPIKATL